MTLQQLRYVIAIAETGSFNKAAEKLYISQPSLTAAIRDLEDEMNILIFNRTSRGVTLTNEGEEFVAYARELYHHYEIVMDKYGKIGITPTNYLRSGSAWVCSAMASNDFAGICSTGYAAARCIKDYSTPEIEE